MRPQGPASPAANVDRIMSNPSASIYDAHTTLRELQSYLADSVRNDWAFPPTAAGPVSAPVANPQRPDLEYRERYYGTSSASSSDPSDIDDAPDTGVALANGHRRGSSITNPYRFDNPDSVGHSQEKRKDARKRRKIDRFGDELEWNAGLAFFEARRNAWTQATVDANTLAPKLATDAPHSPSSTEPQTETASTSLPLVPVANPLLPPDHSMRRQASSPSSYSDIYTRIVAAGTTPKIPINALHITRSLVQGWKESGEWPPRSTAPEPSMGRKRIDFGTRAKESILAHHPHMRRGVEGMKRVFRLSGSGHSLKEGG